MIRLVDLIGQFTLSAGRFAKSIHTLRISLPLKLFVFLRSVTSRNGEGSNRLFTLNRVSQLQPLNFLVKSKRTHQCDRGAIASNFAVMRVIEVVIDVSSLCAAIIVRSSLTDYRVLSRTLCAPSYQDGMALLQ